MTQADGLRLIGHLSSYARQFNQATEVELCLDRFPGDTGALPDNLRVLWAHYPQNGDDLLIDLRALAELLLFTCGNEENFARRGSLMTRVRLALLEARGQSLSISALSTATGLKQHGLQGRIKAKADRWGVIIFTQSQGWLSSVRTQIPSPCSQACASATGMITSHPSKMLACDSISAFSPAHIICSRSHISK